MVLTRRNFMGASAALAALSSLNVNALTKAIETTGIKDYFKDDFKIGTAISSSTLKNNDMAMLKLIAQEFSAITAENCMKWERIHPDDAHWNWDLADKFVEFGLQHQQYILGHCLVWHSQVPPNVFKDANGAEISKEDLLAKMQAHISTVAGRYKGKITAWDVVNEAIEEDGSFRKSPWFNILGEEFIAKAFHFAHEVDPNAHLIYNDFNTVMPKKRAGILAMVEKFKKQGVPIQGVGLQSHLGIDSINLEEEEQTLVAFAKAGVRVHVTELDIDVLPSVWNLPTAEISTRFDYKPERDPYINGLPADIEEKLAQKYEAIFKLYLKHRDKIDRITLWGTTDKESWLNGFPIRGRTNYPLLFDREAKPKLAYAKIINLKK